MSWEMIFPGVMVLALIIVLRGAQRKKKPVPVVPVVVIFALLAVYGVLILYMKGTLAQYAPKDDGSARASYFTAAGKTLGNLLAGECLGTDVLIIADQNYKDNKDQSALIDGMMDSLAIINKDQRVAWLEFKEKEDPQKPEVKQFNRLLKKYEGCDLVVSLVGLPPDACDLSVFDTSEGKKPPHKLAVLAGEGFVDLKEEIMDGRLFAIVMRDPGKEIPAEAAPADTQEAFNKAFILVTAKNYEAVAKKLPAKFTSKK